MLAFGCKERGNGLKTERLFPPMCCPVTIQRHDHPHRGQGARSRPGGKSVQFHRLRDHGVQTVEAPAHIARRGTEINAYAGRQMHHARSRKTLNTVRKVAASAPGEICSLSPQARSSSMGALPSATGVPASTRANRTGSASERRFRQ